MNFEIKLKTVIKEKYGSVRAFAQSINMPYSTIDNIFKRGIMGVSIQVVLKICSELNIDVEKIQDDELVEKKSFSISDEGHELYNQLDSYDKAEIRGEMKQMLKASKYNKTSIGDEIADDITKLMNMHIHTNSK